MSELPPGQAEERIRAAMAGGNFEIKDIRPGTMAFLHGTFLTQTATMLPKRGCLTIQPHGDGSLISYEIELYGFMKYWLMFIGIALCWLIFPAIFASRSLTYHPRRLMENLLQVV